MAGEISLAALRQQIRATPRSCGSRPSRETLADSLIRCEREASPIVAAHRPGDDEDQQDV
jgi:hypothetical protein